MGVAAVQHSFSGHETFPFRYPWLKKGFDAAAEDGGVFSRDDALTTLGVGKNMVRSIRHWCLAAGVLEEGGDGVRPSPLGTLLLADGGLDPYLEDPATLWLVHWQIASNRARATTWFWAFSHFHEPEFTRETLAAAVFRWAQTLPGKKVAQDSVRRDVEVFLRTYVASRQGRADVPVSARPAAGAARCRPPLRRPAVLGGVLPGGRNPGGARRRAATGRPRPALQDRRVVP